MGAYDMPAFIKTVKENTNSSNKIVVVTHSLSCTAATIYAALYAQESAESISLYIMMAPSNFLNNTNVVFKVMAPFADQIYVRYCYITVFLITLIIFFVEDFVKLSKDLQSI